MKECSAMNRLSRALLLAPALLLACVPALAQYPVKPIRFIVGFPPGGSADPTTRILGAALTQQLGQPLVPLLPEVPTIAEAGAPGVTVRQWAGVFGPPKMPREIVERLNREINAALKRPEVLDKLQGYGYAAEGSTPEGLAAVNRDDLALWRRLVREANIPLE